MKFTPYLAMLMLLLPAAAFGAAPYSNQPAEAPDIPIQFGSMQQTQGGALAPLPPQLPKYLPNGAINLDEAWIEDGGARLYWNALYIPIQVKLAGATWVDPALVPQLFPDKTTPRRSYRYRYRAPKAKKAVVRKQTKPAKTTAAASPKIPLPVTPLPADNQTIPPLKAQAAQKPETASAHQIPISQVPMNRDENPNVVPPRLQ